MIFYSTASNSTLEKKAGIVKLNKAWGQPGFEDEDDLDKGGDICGPKSEGKEDLVELLDDDHSVEGEGPMDRPETHGGAKNHHIHVPKEHQDHAHISGDHLPAWRLGEHKALNYPTVEHTRKQPKGHKTDQGILLPHVRGACGWTVAG